MKFAINKLGCCMKALPFALLMQSVIAQEDSQSLMAEVIQPEIEETVVLGRIKSASQGITIERMEHESVTDILGVDQISRVGDSNVATALRRVPGVTLVDDKFIYVRGLGERYSSVTLNGASVPSPDLTRSVLPLDIFPTFILDSLEVQKGFTADMPAAFGGGNIDIRTKGIPAERVFSIEVGGSWNSEDGDAVGYPGGGDDNLGTDDGTRALPAAITAATNTYLGDISAPAIRNRTNDTGGNISLSDAQVINQQLATSLNRNYDFTSESLDQDFGGEIRYGDNFMIDNGWEVGFLSGLSYSTSYRNNETITRSFGQPEEQFQTQRETTRSVDITASATAGVRFNAQNEVNASYIFIRNTDDEASIENIFNSDRTFSEQVGFREYEARFEERELDVLQLTGSHVLDEDVRSAFKIDALSFMDGLELNWFYSDSEATTDIPGEFRYEVGTNNAADGSVVSENFSVSQRMLNYRFTDLIDKVESAGFEFNMPIYTDNMEISLKAGAEGANKARTYRQTDIFLGSSASPADLASILGGVSDTFSDENLLNSANRFAVALDTGNRRSYLAAVTQDAIFGQIDINFDYTYRVVLGARWEEYVQVGLPWDPLDFTGNQIDTSDTAIAEATFQDDDIYPSISLAYMREDFFWAEDWQLRFSASETVVRPDLREVTASSYRDPLTNFIVSGNPDVVPSDVTNLDFRMEWFFEDGDTFTFSAFYKDITNPIEYFETPASDNKRAAEIQNAESAEVYGVEFEWLQGLDLIHSSLTPFFLSGNVTLADSSLTVGDAALVTSNERTLQGASKYVANLSLGFDSDDGKHAAQLSYNVSGERIFAGGLSGTPDSFEQPFNSLDLTYSWYPSYLATVKLRFKNILDEKVEITQNDVVTFEETVGTTASIDVEFQF